MANKYSSIQLQLVETQRTQHDTILIKIVELKKHKEGVKKQDSGKEYEHILETNQEVERHIYI